MSVKSEQAGATEQSEKLSDLQNYNQGSLEKNNTFGHK